jgi:hypothetical protein
VTSTAVSIERHDSWATERSRERRADRRIERTTIGCAGMLAVIAGAASVAFSSSDPALASSMLAIAVIVDPCW